MLSGKARAKVNGDDEKVEMALFAGWRPSLANRFSRLQDWISTRESVRHVIHFAQDSSSDP